MGNLLGALAAYKRKTVTDNVLLTAFITLSQTPYYWLAMLLLYVFAVILKRFPLSGAYTPGMIPSLTFSFIIDMLYHYVLPFFSIVIGAIGGWAIGMRTMAIYELKSDYVSYVDALGLSDRKILQYVFKNSMLPQVTGLAINLGLVLGGALITELVFSYPGTGFLIFRALSTLDYPLIQGTFILLVSTLLLANFIVDLIYAFIDPRIKTGYVGE
ncbi:MAG: ABC transporter permease [Candidatus Bathyarchaeota archaeon]|nr:ABC transporter permease [Candidatus Bathyarchaeota archaeon]